jgi:hypothetical protein
MEVVEGKRKTKMTKVGKAKMHEKIEGYPLAKVA